MAYAVKGEWFCCSDEECDEKYALEIVRWHSTYDWYSGATECDPVYGEAILVEKDCDHPYTDHDECWGDYYEVWEERGETAIARQILAELPKVADHWEFFNRFREVGKDRALAAGFTCLDVELAAHEAGLVALEYVTEPPLDEEAGCYRILSERIHNSLGA